MTETYYNIHNLVKVRVVTERRGKLNEIESHLREFRTSAIAEEEIELNILDYNPQKKLENYSVISDYYYYTDNWLDIPSEKTCFNLVDKVVTVQCDTMRLPLNLLVEMVLLRKGYSLIHSAGFYFNGHSFLIPTFGGVGKTLTITKLIKKDAKIFGDDLVIISSKEILSYPLDFSIYPYHLKILDVDDRNVINELKRTEFVDNIIGKFNGNGRVSKLLKIILRSLRKPYLSISPNQLFRKDVVKQEGKIKKAIFLQKKAIESENIIVKEMNPAKLSEISTDILTSEWHASIQLLLMYSGLSEFSFNKFRDKINNTFLKCFESVECLDLVYPTKINLDEYINQLESQVLN